VLSFREPYALNRSTGVTRGNPSKASRPHILASVPHLQTVSEACPPQEPSRKLGSQPQPQHSSLLGELGLKRNMAFTARPWDWVQLHTSPRTRPPSSRHPPFTHYPFPPRSLVCGGQTSPHKPRLVVSHSTCPPLSSSPHAHSFVLLQYKQQPGTAGGLVVTVWSRSCTSHPHTQAGVLGSIPKREEPGKTGAPCVEVPGSSTIHNGVSKGRARGPGRRR